MTIGEGWGAAKAVANLARSDVNRSVERVEALDEASIEPVQRNKTMTRALAYGGIRDSVIARRASH